MRLIAISLVSALALAFACMGSVEASLPGRAVAGMQFGHIGSIMQEAFAAQTKIWVGRTRSSDRWRCHVVVGGVVYMSADRTEGRAREKLRPYTSGYIFCKPVERFFRF